MASTAFKTVYREEYIDVFERGYSRLRMACTTKADVKGNAAVFLNAGSGSATAVTRGPNGLIAARNNDLTQNTATLSEWHDLPEATRFTTDMSQGDIRRLMQEKSVEVLNRKIDEQIIEQLDTATNDTGTSVTASMDMVAKSLAILGENDVDISEEDKLFGVITPAFHGYLMQVSEYANANYVNMKVLDGPQRNFRRWAGVNWILHSGLTGMGTSTEKCYLFHSNAIGHACDKEQLDVAAGYDDRQDVYWARASGFIGAKLLQNAGVVQMKHDGSTYTAS